MRGTAFVLSVLASGGIVLTPPSGTAQQVLHGHVPEAVTRLHLHPVGRLPSTNHLRLAIGLPLRNTEALTSLLQQLYDPASTNYHHYLTPQQFTERFGPTKQDYQAVIAFAKANALQVVGTHSNRLLLDVSGIVSDVETAFHVTLHIYKHPTEPRLFYAPDVEPSVDLSVPILDISGLNNYAKPHPMGHVKQLAGDSGGTSGSGSGPGGYFMGKDFRNAYIPSVKLDGSGQIVGLLEFDGYYPSDITAYESKAGLSTNISLQILPIDGGVSTPGSFNDEVSMDIELVISMATNLAGVVVFEAPSETPAEWNDMLNSMAFNIQIKQFSSSWWIPGPNATGDQILQEIAAQGQSFFQASGDGAAYIPILNPVEWPTDNPYITSVGGTTLTMNDPGTSYNSETVWNTGWTPNVGSAGGISTTFSIPSWQQDISMTANAGSTKMRNVPDVAMVATNIVGYYHGDSGPGFYSFYGTSAAAPLWAGFMALVNQQAEGVGIAFGEYRVGFINPGIYKIGNTTNYNSCFNDITNGNNTWLLSPINYNACTGYDLCTGWGTPKGSNLINALAPIPTPPSIATQPQNQSVATGGTASFTIDAIGLPPLIYQWYHNGTQLVNGGNISGAYSTNLVISDVQTNNGGYYYATVANALTYVTSGNAVLSVYVTTPPATITFDDLPTTADGSGFYTGPVPSVYDALNWSNCYVINAVLATNTGAHAGMVSSSNVVYNGNGSTASIYSSSTFDFLSGYLTSVWTNDLQVEVEGYIGTQATPTYDNFYTLSATAPTNITFDYFGVAEVHFISIPSGYQFVMDNVVVSTNLAIATPPQIIIQPANTGAILRSSVTFPVSATGTPPLDYQWLKNGSRLFDRGHIFGSATSALTVSNISGTDVGTYCVIVSNLYGSVASTAALLLVYMPGAAITITFDDLSTPTPDSMVVGSYWGTIPGGYCSLNWSNFDVADAMDFPTGSGLQAGMISPKNVAFNAGGNSASITSTSPFNFLSAYLTAAWNDNLQVKVQGFVGSTLAYDNTYTLSATGFTNISFDYLGVDKVNCVSSGGTHHASYTYVGMQFAMDNVTIATNLPVSVLPTVLTLATTRNTILFSWAAIVGQTYQVQYTTNLSQAVWNSLSVPMSAISRTMTASDLISNSQRFYRVVLIP
jgi:hypothetical protein